MRLFLAATAVTVAIATAPGAAPGHPAEAVIGSQIEHFKSSDFAGAFDYASPSIKRIFGSAERFGMMVRQGYPMVVAPQDLRFLDRREVPGGVMQKVMIRGPEGRLHLLDYRMIETPEGWRIDGVWLLEPAGTGV